MARIFISYKRVDKDLVFKIRHLIESQVGCESWIDLEGIESDAQFKGVIISAINECEVVLFMYSKAHTTIQNFEKDWTVRELNYASAKNKRIVFVNIDGTPLTDEFMFDFGMKQQVDGRSQDSLDRLIRDLRKWLNIPTEVDYSQQKQQKPAAEANEHVDKKQQGDGRFHETFSRLIGDLKKHLNTPYEVGFSQQKPTTYADELFDKGNKFHVSKDYQNAVPYFRKAAEQGHAAAQCYLGWCYANGKGVEKDCNKAVELFSKAAEQGHVTAKFYLDLFFPKDTAVRKEYNEAKKSYELAAKQGDKVAQFMLNTSKIFSLLSLKGKKR